MNVSTCSGTQLYQPAAARNTVGIRTQMLQVAILLATLISVGVPCHAQIDEAQWELGPTGSQASLRGLAATDDDVLWVSGSGATVLRSLDGGSSWQNCSPPGFGELEFRSIHAWNAESACVASAGTPAIILLTGDAGKSWREVFRFEGKQAFFDGLRFWGPRRGVAFSDPVDGHLLVVETHDGGNSWSRIAADRLPVALAGEAGFAASNSAMCVGDSGAIWIGTGGCERASSRVHFRQDWQAPWQIAECPIASAMTRGVFSIALVDQRLVAVGGDYRPEAESGLTAAWSDDGGATWQAATTAPKDFRSAVIALPKKLGMLATGPNGTDFSLDGRTWEQISSHGFHALATSQLSVYGVGADGKFGKLVLP